MTEAMPFLQNYDITFLRPPAILRRVSLFDIDFAYLTKVLRTNLPFYMPCSLL